MQKDYRLALVLIVGWFRPATLGNLLFSTNRQGAGHFGRVWESSGSGSARRFRTGEAGAAPNSCNSGAAPNHLQEELEPNCSSVAPAPAPHTEPSSRSPNKHALLLSKRIAKPLEML